MKTPPNQVNSVRDRLSNRADCSNRYLRGASGHVSIGDMLRGTGLGGRLMELRGQSVLVTTRDQLAAAVALIELDGVASRIVICPSDITSEHLPSLIARGGIDAIVSDYDLDDLDWPNDLLLVKCSSEVVPASTEQWERRPSEWVLLTSGTTGAPKMIVHSLASLIAPIDLSQVETKQSGVVWGTFYDIRRYGGLQIFLRAILGCGSLVLSSAGEPVADHLARLTHTRDNASLRHSITLEACANESRGPRDRAPVHSFVGRDR